jgi:hypothetical protein
MRAVREEARGATRGEGAGLCHPLTGSRGTALLDARGGHGRGGGERDGRSGEKVGGGTRRGT